MAGGVCTPIPGCERSRDHRPHPTPVEETQTRACAVGDIYSVEQVAIVLMSHHANMTLG